MRQVLNEIRRFAWSDLSTHRVIAMPVVLLILFWIIVEKAGDDGLPSALQMTVSGFFLLVLVWGAFNAAGSVPEERRAGSWDNIRLSSVSPFAFMWGRLFGCTVYQWYAGLVLLGFYVSYAFNVYPVDIAMVQLSSMVMLTLFCHATAMLSSLNSAGGRFGAGRFVGGGCFVFSILVTGLLYMPLMGYMKRLLRSYHHASYSMPAKIPQTEWFSFSLPSYQLWAIVIGVFCIWSLIGLYRTLRREFKLPVIPWVWGLFVLFCMIAASGFIDGDTPMSRRMLGHTRTGEWFESLRLAMAISVGFALTYIALIMNHVDATQYRKLAYHFRLRSWLKVAELTPAWIITFAFAVIVVLLHTVPLLASQGLAYTPVMLVLGLFVLRDVGIIHFFAFSPRNGRAMMASLFYLAMLYFLLPIIVKAADADDLMILFYPHKSGGLQLIILLVEAGVVWLLVRKRWKRLQQL